VLIDLVVPWQFATADIEPARIELDGASIESVAPVDAIESVVGLVIDDGPNVPTDVVQAAQGASVELVRNIGNGTAIALSTPSGMQTTPTTDRGASIARIAGITAGAPDVVPLHRLVLDAAERLAATAWPDRHLVLVLGRPINEPPTLQELAEIAAGADMRLHVIADPRIDTGAAANLAARTGGVASGGRTMLAEVDQVTAAIAHRVRVTATVTDPGPHELVLTLNGSRFVTEVDVPAPPATSASAPTTAEASATVGTVATEAAPAPATDITVTAAPPTVAAAGSTGSGSDRDGVPLWLAVALMVGGVTALGWLWLSAHHRRTRPTEPAAPSAQPAMPAPVTQPAARVIEPVGASTPPAAAASRSPEPAPAIESAAPDDQADDIANGTPSAARRRPVDRPRRATPRRRPPPDAPPPPDPDPEEPVAAGDWLVVDRLRLNRNTHEVFSASRRITLTAAEFAVLELLMTGGGHGVTRDAIHAAAFPDGIGEEAPDLDGILAELRRKTGIRGRGRGVRSERTLVYFFGE
jgi:hypothetical protein